MAEITKKEFLDILNDFKGEILHQFSIISEDLTTKVEQVAEGVSNLNEKFDRRLDELTGMNDSQHKDILAAIKFSYAGRSVPRKPTLICGWGQGAQCK